MKLVHTLAPGLLLAALTVSGQAADINYDAPFFPGAEYPSATPEPRDCLGFPMGSRAAKPAEIGRCLDAWAPESARMHVVTYAHTHEGRPLYYVLLGTPDRIAGRESLREKLGRLSDPRGLSGEEADALLGEIPAVAWLAHSIHGDETSGADAALALIHHLAFDDSEATARLLEDVLVIVDPMMNPDGRHRFLQQVAEYRSESPNVDHQSGVHAGYWPWGRTNHYLFDLNRDWLFGVHPETRGRMKAVREWNPQLFVDAHEMGPLDSYLFSPPRDPVNPNMPEWQSEWYQRFAADQAAAFDRQGWRYYTGEWNEGWYPGYSNSWAAMRGSIGLLYEQAGVADAGVLQPSGQVLSYRESVHHQVASALANLDTLASNAAELKRGYLEQRRDAVSGDGPYADRTFAVLPTDNRGRLAAFRSLMALHGLEAYELTESTRVSGATDQLGRDRGRTELPAGTLLIPNRQPSAQLAAALLEFDPRIPEATLDKERDKLLREGSTRIYDVTAWNLTMMYGLEALSIPSGLPGGAEKVNDLAAVAGNGGDGIRAEAIGWFFDGADDRSQRAAAHLMQNGVNVRLAKKATRLAGVPVPAASPVVLADDNRELRDELVERLRNAANAASLSGNSINAGLGTGDLADLGGEHFPLLEPPRVALVNRGSISAYDFGAIWHHLDQRLGLEHSHIAEDQLTHADLRRYNLIVLPDRWEGQLPEPALEALKSWVETGGTLVAVGGSASQLATEKAGIGNARLLPDVVDATLPYRVDLAREWQAATGNRPDADAVWSHDAPRGLSVPWNGDGEEASGGAPSAGPPPGDEKDSEEKQEPLSPAAQRDRWQALFMPQGAIVAGRVDDESWLGLGVPGSLPVLVNNAPVLMAADTVQAPVRYGVLEPDDDAGSGDMGWAPMPEGHELRVRMSGLLWPEAANRLANAAWLTRETVGRGQVILFGSPPVFRGATLGTARVLGNAVLYGPGLGASVPIEPRR